MLIKIVHVVFGNSSTAESSALPTEQGSTRKASRSNVPELLSIGDRVKPSRYMDGSEYGTHKLDEDSRGVVTERQGVGYVVLWDGRTTTHVHPAPSLARSSSGSKKDRVEPTKQSVERSRSVLKTYEERCERQREEQRRSRGEEEDLFIIC